MNRLPHHPYRQRRLKNHYMSKPLLKLGPPIRATTNADQCIARFGEAANRSQAALEEENVTLPKGKVSEAEANRIRQYQILHDVAACFLIKGWAEERLGRREEARKAYTEARKYTLARSSMPSGESFWSPAEKASESAAKLEKAPSQ